MALIVDNHGDEDDDDDDDDKAIVINTTMIGRVRTMVTVVLLGCNASKHGPYSEWKTLLEACLGEFRSGFCIQRYGKQNNEYIMAQVSIHP